MNGIPMVLCFIALFEKKLFLDQKIKSVFSKRLGVNVDLRRLRFLKLQTIFKCNGFALLQRIFIVQYCQIFANFARQYQ